MQVLCAYDLQRGDFGTTEISRDGTQQKGHHNSAHASKPGGSFHVKAQAQFYGILSFFCYPCLDSSQCEILFAC
jgi:hypothetical protein